MTRSPTWLWLLLIVVGLALLAVIPFATWLFQQDLPTFSIAIDGSEQVHTVHLGGLSIEHKLVLVAVVFAAIVAVLIAVPVALLVACAAVVLALVLCLGLPLVMVAALVLALLSPLWLLLGLARWIWRPPSQRTSPRRAANIAA